MPHCVLTLKLIGEFIQITLHSYLKKPAALENAVLLLLFWLISYIPVDLASFCLWMFETSQQHHFLIAGLAFDYYDGGKEQVSWQIKMTDCAFVWI